MSCDHAACIFAAALDTADCQRLCEICHIRCFARGQSLSGSYWRNCVVLMLDGVLLDMKQLNEDHPVAVAIHAPGSIFGLEKAFYASGEEIDETRSTYCLTDCKAAIFPAMELHGLIREQPKISHPLMKDSVIRQLKDKTDMLTYLGYGDAKASVSYIVNYLKAHDLNALTHEQIAIICNRSRQTVTTILNQLQSEMDADASDRKKGT